MIRTIRRIWRSAVTGRFVSRLFARANPATTVEETSDWHKRGPWAGGSGDTPE